MKKAQFKLIFSNDVTKARDFFSVNSDINNVLHVEAVQIGHGGCFKAQYTSG